MKRGELFGLEVAVQEVAEAGCSEAEVQIEHRLYNADAHTVLSVIRESVNDANVLLVVGHAPGLPAVASLPEGDAIAALRMHRLKREARILAAMRAQPDGTPRDWLPVAYADVPERMWPMAARSLAAHVERIRQNSTGHR